MRVLRTHIYVTALSTSILNIFGHFYFIFFVTDFSPDSEGRKLRERKPITITLRPTTTISHCTNCSDHKQYVYNTHNILKIIWRSRMNNIVVIGLCVTKAGLFNGRIQETVIVYSEVFSLL